MTSTCSRRIVEQRPLFVSSGKQCGHTADGNQTAGPNRSFPTVLLDRSRTGMPVAAVQRTVAVQPTLLVCSAVPYGRESVSDECP